MEDLKEMIIKNLDSNGVLDVIRAKLRTNVFKAIINEDSKDPNHITEGIKAIRTDKGK